MYRGRSGHGSAYPVGTSQAPEPGEVTPPFPVVVVVLDGPLVAVVDDSVAAGDVGDEVVGGGSAS